MDVIEKAIRNAFEKGDADDRTFRERVYRSAFAALEKALQANSDLSQELADKRRSALQAKIAEIETEFIPAVPAVETPMAAGSPVANGAPSVELDGGRAARPASSPPPVENRVARTVDPVLTIPEPAAGSEGNQLPGSPRPIPEPFFPDATDFNSAGVRADEPQVDIAEISAADGPNVTSERRRPLAAIFLGVTLLALAAIGIWWAVSTGLIKIPGPPDTDGITQVPPDDEEFTPGEEEAPVRPGEADAERDWILVFSPTDPTTINAPSDTTAEMMSDDSGNFVRIRSGASGSAISFDVAQGVLEQISGKHVMFDIVARSEEGKETQFSVDCNFGELGDCGRKRYQAGYEKGDFLFDIDMPAKAPGAEGTIAINSDVDNDGKGIDVFEIKVSVSE